MTVLQKSNSKSWKTNLNDKECHIAVLKKLSQIQENSERQFNELRNKTEEYLTKETEKEPNRNSINEMKNALEGEIKKIPCAITSKRTTHLVINLTCTLKIR